MKHSMESERLAVPVSERDHIQGPEDAPLTLLEYGDYECPYCGQAHLVVKHLQQDLGRRLRFIYRNFPLVDIHPHSEHAAEAAEAAGTRGKFWQMHDILFENQEALEDEDLVEYAAGLGLDSVGLIAEIQGGVFAKRIREDFMSGVKNGVNGTPTFFINGMRYDGEFDLESLLTALAQSNPER